MYRRFLNVNTGNAIKNFDAGGLKVTRAVPEKHIINFFWPNLTHFNDPKICKWIHQSLTNDYYNSLDNFLFHGYIYLNSYC